MTPSFRGDYPSCRTAPGNAGAIRRTGRRIQPDRTHVSIRRKTRTRHGGVAGCLESRTGSGRPDEPGRARTATQVENAMLISTLSMFKP